MGCGKSLIGLCYSPLEIFEQVFYLYGREIGRREPVIRNYLLSLQDKIDLLDYD